MTTRRRTKPAVKRTRESKLHYQGARHWRDLVKKLTPPPVTVCANSIPDPCGMTTQTGGLLLQLLGTVAGHSPMCLTTLSPTAGAAVAAAAAAAAADCSCICPSSPCSDGVREVEREGEGVEWDGETAAAKPPSPPLLRVEAAGVRVRREGERSLGGGLLGTVAAAAVAVVVAVSVAAAAVAAAVADSAEPGMVATAGRRSLQGELKPVAPGRPRALPPSPGDALGADRTGRGSGHDAAARMAGWQ